VLPLAVVRNRPPDGANSLGPDHSRELSRDGGRDHARDHADEGDDARDDRGRAPVPREPIAAQLRAGWAEPGTRLGFWVHFTTPFAGGVFGLLWGYPFLVQGEGLSPGTAGGLLTLMVAEAMVLGPGYGTLTGRRPGLRLPLVGSVVAVNVAAWAAVLLWPGRAPLWLLVLLVAALGTGGSASLVGFEIARATNPPQRVGTVSGMVNVGGFSAMVVLLVAVGWILDAHGSGAAGRYTLAGFKDAFAAQFLLFGLGATQIARLSRQVAAASGPADPRKGSAYPLTSRV
jgi:hypothetical protein